MSFTLRNKIVLITGASSGIGQATARQFAQQGAKLILTARRFKRLQQLAEALRAEFSVEILPLQLDVRDKHQVTTVINSLADKWSEVAVLVNNAGLALSTNKLQEGRVEDWDTMIDTNLRGLLYVTHALLPGMVSRNCGHIINVGSVAGREHYPGGNVYCATKHAVRAITHSLRIDLLGTAVRVSEIQPGAVHTEFSEVRWQDKQKSDDFYAEFEPLYAEDIADGIVYCATRPPHVDIAEMVIYPTAQASCNHIYRSTK